MPAKIFLLLFLSPAFIFARAQDDRQAFGFKGNVKTVRVVTYSVKVRNGVVEKKKQYRGGNDSLVFNENGILSGRTLYFFNDVYSRHYVYIRDDSNNVIEKRQHSAEGGTVSESFTSDWFAYSYNSDGRLSERREFWSTQEIRSDSIRKRTVYSYDSAGRMIASRETWSDGRLVEEFTYRYNADGTLAEESEKSPFADFRVIYSYDSLGRISQKTIARANRKKTLNYFYKYNDKGDVIEEQLSLGKKHGVRTHEYEYDQQGNKIRETVFVNGKAKQVREWKITYF